MAQVYIPFPSNCIQTVLNLTSFVHFLSGLLHVIASPGRSLVDYSCL